MAKFAIAVVRGKSLEIVKNFLRNMYIHLIANFGG